MRHIRSLVIGVFLLTALVGAAGALLVANTLHVPRRIRAASGSAVQVAAQDGAVLRASWFPSTAADSHACVLILHGIGDSRAGSAGFAPLFHDHGYAVLAPDSRAHGESGGDLVTYGLLEKYDVIRWTSWMRAQGCERLYGLGESLGASVLIQAAAVEPAFSALVAESAFADLPEIARYRVARMSPFPSISGPAAAVAVASGRVVARVEYGVDLGAASPVHDIARVRVPILLIHGLADDQTPPSNSQALAAANPEWAKLWLVPGLHHQSAYSVDPAEYRRRVLAWFGVRGLV